MRRPPARASNPLLESRHDQLRHWSCKQPGAEGLPWGVGRPLLSGVNGQARESMPAGGDERLSAAPKMT